MIHDRNLTSGASLPNWVPPDARAYLEHIHNGQAMRALARRHGRHASTVLRHVRRLENRRDDLLVDEALSLLGACYSENPHPDTEEIPIMTTAAASGPIADDSEIEKEARRILRRLCETSAFLIIAPSMDKAAVLRETVPGKPVRIAVVARHIAQAFALKDWIECFRKGKVWSYRITTAGKSALKRLLADENKGAKSSEGFSEAPSPFLEQHKDWEQRETRDDTSSEPRQLRYNLAESPLTALGRRKTREGTPFLTPDLIQAGERLREDFEMAQMGPRVTQNWDRFLTSGRGEAFGSAGPAEGPRRARENVAAALKALGPGLGDIAMRCCCYLEGMETAEKRMGWSARSGKIVLRIALQRLKLHYEERHGTLSPLIG